MKTSFASLFCLLALVASTASADTIDFENGTTEGATVGTIDGVQFTGAIYGEYGGASASERVGWAGAFGNDSLDPSQAGGIDQFGDWFITDLLVNDNSGRADEFVPGEITIDFQGRVNDVSFSVFDINFDNTERLIATTYSGATMIEQINFTENDRTDAGDSLATLVQFQSSTPITSLTVRVQRDGFAFDSTDFDNRVGWGMDNLQFTVVPAPSSLVALLGLAGMGLVFAVRRRRNHE